MSCQVIKINPSSIVFILFPIPAVQLHYNHRHFIFQIIGTLIFNERFQFDLYIDHRIPKGLLINSEETQIN